MTRCFWIFLLFAIPQLSCKTRMIESSPKIIGGELVLENEYRYSLRILPNCSGTMISPIHILTVAHCLINTNTGKLEDWFTNGSRILYDHGAQFDRSKNDLYGQSTITKTIFHPLYKSMGENKMDQYDLAIIEIEKDRQKSTNIPTNRGFSSISSDPVREGETLTTVGAGLTGSIDGPCEVDDSKLRKAQFQVVTPLIYGQYFETKKTSAPRICSGDSGGGVFRETGDNHWELVGVVAGSGLNLGTRGSPATQIVNKLSLPETLRWINSTIKNVSP